jgi:molybdopterin molybdotransferase
MLADCFAAPGKLIGLDQALAFLAERIAPVVETETLPVEECHGRVLAGDVVARVAAPPFTNSAMDGFAYRHADLAADGTGATLIIAARIAAGHPFSGQLGKGEAARIFTGAPMPSGLDTVAMQEDCEVSERNGVESVRVPNHERGHFVREAGEDFAAGQVVVGAGCRLRPQDVAIAAASGHSSLSVYRPLRVAVFSTGDEVVAPGQPLPPGAIYSSNPAALSALARGFGCSVIDLGNLPDDLDITRRALAEAADQYDLLLTAGGVSVGGEDHLKGAIEAQGTLHLWRLAIKPGKPTALGQIGKAAIVGLPGNPVSAQVMLMIFGRPVIKLLSGATAEPLMPFPFKVPAAVSFDKKDGRREFLRARLVQDQTGLVSARPFGSQDSHLVSSLVESDGLIDVREGARTFQIGDPVDFIPYRMLQW